MPMILHAFYWSLTGCHVTRHHQWVFAVQMSKSGMLDDRWAAKASILEYGAAVRLVLVCAGSASTTCIAF
jgi:hypothetical protein